MINKDKLAELIDAYAVAKASNNKTLLDMTVVVLKEAIDSIYSDSGATQDAEQA